jgi:hypothetical protein
MYRRDGIARILVPIPRESYLRLCKIRVFFGYVLLSVSP